MVTRVTPSVQPDGAVTAALARDIDACGVRTITTAAAAGSNALHTRRIRVCAAPLVATWRVAVQRVVAHRVPDVLQVQPNLVRPARLELAEKERRIGGRIMPEAKDDGARRLGTRAGRRAGWRALVPGGSGLARRADGHIDHLDRARADPAPGSGQVELPQCSVAEELRVCGGRRGSRGQEEDACATVCAGGRG
eukprot:scaffold7712_cov119-Isochrysis_galbana.AAC.8